MTPDAKIKEIRDMKGLARRTNLTLEGIVKRIQPRTFEDVGERVEVDEFVPEGFLPLD